jgi:hypothetical protein
LPSSNTALSHAAAANSLRPVVQQTPGRRRSSVSEASGPDRAEATRRLQEVSAPPSRVPACHATLVFKTRTCLGKCHSTSPTKAACCLLLRAVSCFLGLAWRMRLRWACLSVQTLNPPQEAAAQRPESLEGVRTADRRARQVTTTSTPHSYAPAEKDETAHRAVAWSCSHGPALQGLAPCTMSAAAA